MNTEFNTFCLCTKRTLFLLLFSVLCLTALGNVSAQTYHALTDQQADELAGLRAAALRGDRTKLPEMLHAL